MGSFSIWHWLVVLAIVMLLFGTGKLRNIGTDLGGAVRGVKDGMKGGEFGHDADGAGAAPSICGRISDGVGTEESRGAKMR